MKSFLINVLPGWVTTTGAGAVLAASVEGYVSGRLTVGGALFQGGLGVIAIGLRRAISRLGLNP
jgi:hypothetical protein